MRLGRELRKARDREREAAGREQDAAANFRDAANKEEAARRCGAGAAARTDAIVRMNAAGAVLEADRAALQGATAVREDAERQLAAARGRVARLEAALNDAQGALDTPGRPPRSAVTLVADLARQVMAGDLTEAERFVIRCLGQALAEYTGAAQDIAARAVEIAEREREDARKKAVFLRPLGNGMVGAMANPAIAGKPLP